MAESSPKRSTSGLRRVWIALFSVGMILVFVLAGIRFYLSDARLKTMIESQVSQAIGSPLSIGEFEFSFLDGLQLHSIQLGDKSTAPLAAEVKTLSIQWEWQNQSWTHIQIREFTIQGLALYKNQPTPSEPKTPKETDASPQSLQDIVLPKIPTQHWPLLVELQNIQIELKKLQINTPDYNAELDGLMLEGSLLLGDGLAKTKLNINTITQYTQIVLKSASKLSLEGAPKVQINLTTAENENILFSGQLNLPMAEQSISLESDLALDLSQGLIDIKHINLGLGESSHLKTQLQAKKLYTAPALEIKSLGLQLDFHSLQPFMDIFEVPLQSSGKASAQVQPATIPSLNKEALKSLILDAEIQTEKLQVYSGIHRLESLDGSVILHYEKDSLQVSSQDLIFSFSNPQIRLESAHLKLKADTVLSDWIGPQPLGKSQLELQARIPKTSAAQASISKIHAQLELSGPTSILKNLSATEPLEYTLSLQTGSIQQDDKHLASLDVQSQGQLYDLGAHKLVNELQLAAKEIHLPTPTQTIDIQEALALVSVRKTGQAFDFQPSSIKIDDLLSLNIQGGIEQPSSESVSFSKFTFAGEAYDLEKILNWTGPNPNAPLELSGQANMSLELDGPLALAQLQAEAQVPPLPPLDDVEEWEQEAQPLVEYIGRWMQKLSGELGFTADLNTTIETKKLVHTAASTQDLKLKLGFVIDDKSTRANVDWSAKELGAAVAMSNAKGHLFLTVSDQSIDFKHDLRANRFEHSSLDQALEQLTLHQEATYRFGKDLHVERSLLQTKDQALLVNVKGLIHHPIRTLASGALLQENLPGVRAQLDGRLKVESANQWQIIRDTPTLQGKLDLDATIDIENGAIALQGDMACEQLSIASSDFMLKNLLGKIPMSVLLESYKSPNNMSIAHGVALGGGTLYLLTNTDSDKQERTRKVYYEDLRPYRQEAGLEIGYLKFGDYELSNILLDAKIQNGTLSANHFSTELLGGDVLGNLALQINSNREFSGMLVLQASNIDASHFAKLDLQPGPDSELSADMRLSLFAAPTQRDINLDVNITQVGKKTLDRFLQLLDPESKDSQIQRTRSNLQLINIHQVTAWIRHENLNMDLDYTTRLSIPGTNIGFRPIDRELLRRYAITEKVIDPYFQSYVDRYLAKSLGWNHEAP